MRVTEQSIARQVTEALLHKLNISATEVDKLQTVPYQQLNQAGDEALREVATRLGLKDGFNNPGNMSWAPVMDGDFLPQQPDASQKVSSNVSLIVGSNMTEMNSTMMMFNPDFQTNNKSTWNNEEKQERLRERFGNHTDAVVAAFNKAYPERDAIDALYVDSWIRSNSLRYMALRAAEASAPVYSYMFAFDNPQNPLMMTPHTAEIAYVFNNLGRNPMGGGQVTDEAQRVADAMSDAWISFARTGNPSTSVLQWPAFTSANRATMLFAKENGVRIGFDDDLMRQLVPDYDFMK